MRVLGEGPDPHLHRPQRVEMSDQLRGRDADEPGGEATLRHERLGRPRGDGAHRAGHCHVLGQIEVVGVRLAGGLGDREVAVVGQARDHRFHRVRGEVVGECVRVGRVQGEGSEIARSVGTHHALGRRPGDVRQLDLVTPRFG